MSTVNLGLGPVGIHNRIFLLSKISCAIKLDLLFDERKGLTATGHSLSNGVTLYALSHFFKGTTAPVGLGLPPWTTVHFGFSKSYTFGRTPWAGDQLVPRPLSVHKHFSYTTDLTTLPFKRDKHISSERMLHKDYFSKGWVGERTSIGGSQGAWRQDKLTGGKPPVEM
jgi:hypothetical protein